MARIFPKDVLLCKTCKMQKMQEHKLTIAATPSGSLTVINCFPEKKFEYWSATITYYYW